ncbi:MAG: hypothetical protein JRF40_03050 [Deltaproteobacteria bacterium]|nr:hypothetical protein [Deltaproteobacteria bacterium]
MPEEKNNTAAPFEGSETSEKTVFPDTSNTSNTPDTLDAKEIILAVRELNICLKSVNMYPTEHDQVKSSIERAWQILNKIFDHLPSLTLAIAGKNLMIGNEYLDPDNAVCKEFALSLKQHDIASITFYRELDRDELKRIFLVIKRKPDDISEQGGIGAVIENESLMNIKIKTVDYSKLSLTEEKEISRRQKNDIDQQQENVWQNFVSHLVSETITDSDGGVSVDKLEDINPTELARFINENKIDTNNAIRTYDTVVTKHFAKPQIQNQAQNQISTQTHNQTRNQTRNQDRPTTQKSNVSYDLTNWNTLLEELNPEMKQQFLSVSFEHCEPESDSARTEDFLSSMSGGLIIDMLKNASETGKEISPSLINLIRKLSAAQGETLQGIPEDISAALTKSEDAPEVSKDHLKTLFNREKHEEYVVDEYDDILKKLTDSSDAESKTKQTDFSIDDYLATLEDRHLDSRIARILISFMNGNIDKEEYSAYAEKLVNIGKDILDVPEFSVLSFIFKAFQAHRKNKTDQDIRSIAKESINKFREPAFTSMAVAAFFKTGELSDREGFNFLTALGPRIMPDIVKLYAEQDKPEMPGLLSGIITHFRKEALAEAQKRLRDTRTLFVRNLIVMLRILNANEAENSIKQLLEHNNTDIQLEALETLLQFENQWALPVLRKLIRSNQADISSKTIFLSGKFRVKDVAGNLASMLKRYILFKADIKKNEEIISALGQIANPDTIPVLEKLISTTPLLHSRKIAKMKLLAYQSLAGYSYNDVKNLLEKGSKARDAEIKGTCQKIINQKRGEK